MFESGGGGVKDLVYSRRPETKEKNPRICPREL